MIKDKKGMEFAIGTFVSIVLGLSMFIAGTLIFYNIYQGATDQTNIINDRTRDQILRGFTDGNALYLPQTSINVNRQKEIPVYFAIQNTATTTRTFTVNVEHQPGADEQEFNEDNLVYLSTLEVLRQDREVGIILVRTDGLEPRTQYVFTVSITPNDEDQEGIRPRVFTINT